MASEKWKLFEIGSEKITREVTIESDEDLLREVSKHLRSRDVGIDFDDAEGTTGTVYVGGFRPVGKVIRLSA